MPATGLFERGREVRLSIFDLDNTLIGGDSDVLWTDFLVESGVLSEQDREESRRFYREYEDGRMDIAEFLRFQLRPLGENDPENLECWRSRFVEEKISPVVLPGARRLLEKCRSEGHELLIITATNRFITAPIAELLVVENLLATEPEIVNGKYTGRSVGVPCFQEGKIRRLEAWLNENGFRNLETWFYSDSRNDIPLLEYVSHPVAVDPDPYLSKYAAERGWPSISLR